MARIVAVIASKTSFQVFSMARNFAIYIYNCERCEPPLEVNSDFLCNYIYIMFRANREFAQSLDCAKQTWNSKFAGQTYDCTWSFLICARNIGQ